VEINSRYLSLGGERYVISVARDLSEREEARRKYLESEGRYRLVAENTADVIWTMDPYLRLTFISPSVERMFGYTPQEAMQLRLADYMSSASLERVREAADARKRKRGSELEEPIRLELQYVRKDGSAFWAESNVTPCVENGRLTGYVGVTRDIQKRKQAEESLHSMAFYDGLTGLPNRDLFNMRLERAVQRWSCSRTGGRVALLYLDVDKLKAINDTLGHSTGDEVIKAIGGRIGSAVRGEDTVARLHGDEFICLLEGVDSLEEVHQAAERIRRSLQGHLKVNGQELQVTASIGLSVCPDNARDPETLLKQADIALYKAKRNNGSTVCSFVEQDDWLRRYYKLYQELKNALAKGEFGVHYQPVVELKSGRTAGLEALMRWNRTDCSVPAREFVQVLEDSGLIREAGHWLLDAVCRQIAAWRKEGLDPVRVGVNLSDQQIRRSDILDSIRTRLEQTGLEAAHLEFELTESVFKENVESTMRNLGTLSSWGSGIVLDDFGTGYSSLNNLLDMPLDRIKIDAALIGKVPRDEKSRTLVGAMISMAHSLGKEVVAEGVETASQATFLYRKGCDYAQGYYLAEPREARDIERVLLSPEPAGGGR
jgi:diguanylate cyclase (GGDEF)-like protein/PAS domain S-box-containing protein